MSAMALVQRQMAIKIEQDELAKAMETSLKENEALARKRKREEEDKRDRDPVKAYGCATTMSEAALKRMFVDGNGRNRRKPMELCSSRRKQSGGISARNDRGRVRTDWSVGRKRANRGGGWEDFDELDGNASRTDVEDAAGKHRLCHRIFASEEALNGKIMEEVVELDSSSSEEEEGEKRKRDYKFIAHA